jgi:hypothetical protein
MKTGLLAIISTVIMTLSSCNKVVGPHYATQPGPRDYTWQVDTINAGGNILRTIDGSSDSSVWAVGEAGDFRYTIWHFDGRKWSTDSADRPLSPTAVRAISPTDVWAVGEDGQIWNYNGIEWSQQARMALPSGAQLMFLESIDGYSESDLYADGEYFDSLNNTYPLMYHFNGNSWNKVNIQSIPDLGLYKMRFFAPGKALILGYKSGPNAAPPDSEQIYMFNGSSLQLKYSGPETLDGAADFATIHGGIAVLEGRKILFSDGGTFQTLTTVAQPEFGGQIAARSTQDIFIRMLDGIAQYNGTDVQYIFTRPNLNISAMIAFPNSIFAIGYSYTTHLNYVYRGYLPK